MKISDNLQRFEKLMKKFNDFKASLESYKDSSQLPEITREYRELCKDLNLFHNPGVNKTLPEHYQEMVNFSFKRYHKLCGQLESMFKEVRRVTP